MFIPIYFIICYNSQKLGFVNSVYVNDIVSNIITLRTLIKVIVYEFLIFNESLLVLSHSEYFYILIVK